MRCLAGNGVPATIRAASSTDYLWKRVRVFDPWRFHNTCPYLRVHLNDSSYFQNVKFAVAGYMFGPGNPHWEHH